jgi:hypothetical protein
MHSEIVAEVIKIFAGFLVGVRDNAGKLRGGGEKYCCFAEIILR